MQDQASKGLGPRKGPVQEMSGGCHFQGLLGETCEKGWSAQLLAVREESLVWPIICWPSDSWQAK
jgi:hypothetical protein